tara:strand:+ start:53259 stop:54086 length:828 start_codon:yes stop_codon:yes gene_type:complete
LDSIQVFLTNTSLKDIFDIFIVALLIYQGLLIVRGTRAVQMLMGVGLLVLLFWIGHAFKLYSLNWILEHFFDSFFIIAIILFQDQLRHALASVGTGRKLFGFLNREEIQVEIDEVVESIGSMAREKIGCLLVIERNHGLANFMETGTKLNSEVHSDVMYAIFQSSSPLHDGAVIISAGRIAAAGCFLPLTKKVEIDRHLGTRHRAALGLTEDTDAICITVSEETGKINISVNGAFYLCSGPKELRQYLKHLWAQEKLDERLDPIRSQGVSKGASN